MSDWILGGDIDRWITGNYGEDQFKDDVEPDEDEPQDFNEKRSEE